MAEHWFNAARQGQFTILCSLSSSWIKSRDSSGNTALMFVVQNGHSECLKLLEEEATMTNNSGLTALAIAIMCGNNTACAFLAPMEAHILLPSKLSMLMLAAKLGNCDAVNCIAPYAQENNGSCSETALSLAVKGNHLECVRTLLNRIPYTISDIYNELSTSNIDIKILLLERCDSLLEYDISASRTSIGYTPLMHESCDQRISFLKDIVQCLKERSKIQTVPDNIVSNSINMPQLQELNRHIQDCHAYIQTLKYDFLKLQQDKKTMQEGYEEKLQRMHKIYASSISAVQMNLYTKNPSDSYIIDTDKKCIEINTVDCGIMTQESPILCTENNTQTSSPSHRTIAVGNEIPTIIAVSWTGGPDFLPDDTFSHIASTEVFTQTDAPEQSLINDVPCTALHITNSLSSDALITLSVDDLQQELLAKTAEIQALSNELTIMQSTIEHMSDTQSRALTAKDLELEQEIEVFTERISSLSEENLRLEKQNRILQEENTLLSEQLEQINNELMEIKRTPIESVAHLRSPSITDDFDIILLIKEDTGTQTDPSVYLISVEVGDDRTITEPLLPLQQTWTIVSNRTDNSFQASISTSIPNVAHCSCQTSADTRDVCCQVVEKGTATAAIRHEIELACRQVDEFNDRRATRTSLFAESAEKMLTTEDDKANVYCEQSDENDLVYKIEKLEQALKDKNAELSLANDKILRLEAIEQKYVTQQRDAGNESILNVPSNQVRTDTECSQLLSVICATSPQNSHSNGSPLSIEEENKELRYQLESLRKQFIQLTHSSQKSITPIATASNTLASASTKLCELAQRLKKLLDGSHTTVPKDNDSALAFIEELASEILEYSASIQSIFRESVANAPILSSSMRYDISLNDTTHQSQHNTNTDLMEAAILDNVDIATLFLNQVGRRNVDGETALMIASKHGSLEVAKILVQHEANCVRKDGMTALAIALYNKNLDMATLLSAYEGPGSISNKDSPDNNGELPDSALILAARHHDVVSVWTLLKTHTRYQDDQGRTALMHAAEYGFDIIVHLLVEYEAGMQDIDGYTGLMIAANLGHTSVITELHDHEAGMQCARGYTALMYAAAAGHTEAVAVLAPIEAGIQTIAPIVCSANDTTVSTSTCKTAGITALMLAVETGSADCVNILWPLEHHIRDAQGMAPIHYACSESMRNLLRSYQ